MNLSITLFWCPNKSDNFFFKSFVRNSSVAKCQCKHLGTSKSGTASVVFKENELQIIYHH